MLEDKSNPYREFAPLVALWFGVRLYALSVRALRNLLFAPLNEE